MEDFKARYCKLCFTTICNEHDFVLLKPDFDDDNKNEICNACSINLSAAQKFKLTCSYTDNVINSHANDTKVFPLELREIYMIERPSEHVSDDIKICRLCMHPIKNISELKAINEEQVDMILKLVPEMNIFIIKDPVTCKRCLDSLAEHCNFLKKCSDIKQDIENNSNVQIPDAASVDISVKIEDVVKFEEDDYQLIKTECVDINYEKVENESDINGQETTSEAAAYMYKPEQLNRETALERDDHSYKCEKCNYTCRIKKYLKSHMLRRHSDRSKLQIYKCESCNFETRYKAHLKRHNMYIHKRFLKEQMYKCEHCTFETQHRAAFVSHMVMHKNLYKCESCKFETKHKAVLKKHMLIHKDPSEVHMYKCEVCDYESKEKANLKRHMLVHKSPSEVQMYKCESCIYETKYAFYLKEHVLIHKDPSELQMNKCQNCGYETKFKTSLRAHMLIHRDRTELRMHKCQKCNYETKYKARLGRHMLVHKDPSEVQMYKCQTCNFETKYKKAHERHIILQHKDPTEEQQIYKCETCTYETKYKKSLKHHKVIHKDRLEEQM